MVAATTTPAATRAVAAALGRLCQPGDLVALVGDLGAGKTCFAQGLARGLGVLPRVPVHSPSFTMVNEYAGRVPLLHADLYRVADAEELFELGLDELLEGGRVVAVEWADRFAAALPPADIEVRLEAISGQGRRLLIRGSGNRGRALCDALGDALAAALAASAGRPPSW